MEPQMEAAWRQFSTHLRSQWTVPHGVEEHEGNEPIADAWDDPFAPDGPLNAIFGQFRDVFYDNVGHKKSRIIKLNVAIMCLHLLAARFCVKILAKTVVEKVRKLINKAAFWEKVGSQIVKRALPRLAPYIPFINFIITVAQYMLEVWASFTMDSEFKDQADLVRLDMLGGWMNQRKREKRPTEYVYTRHVVQRQRRPNQSWLSKQ